MATTIHAIDKLSIHKICSGQVVLDLATAVKELVENSIDAGATSVDIIFKENGIEGLEVIDDGSGIDPVNYETLALKHYTSKLNSFEDLEKVYTFGFRGEALSSLCSLAQLTVMTATKEQAPMGMKLEYDQNGNLCSKTPISRTVGTTIQLNNLFHSLPVRLSEFKRNIKREYGKALTMLQAYSIISTQVRISVSHQSIAKKSTTKVMSTTRNKQVSANIANVFGAKLVSQIMSFHVDLSSLFEQESSLEGYISRPEWGLGRASSDRQYFFVNSRPCTMSKIAKALNEVYRIFISNQYPVIVANLKVPTDAYDVNVSPDKRTIFIHQENNIVNCILEQLKKTMEPSRSTFQLNPLMSPSSSITAPSSSITAPSSSITAPSSSITAPPSSITAPSSSITAPPSSITAPSSSITAPPSSMTTPSSNMDRSTSIKSTRSLSSFAMSAGNTYRPTQPNSSNKRPYTALTSTSTLLNYINKKPKLDKQDTQQDSSQEQVTSIQAVNTATPTLASTEPSTDTREYVEIMTGIKSYSGLHKTTGRTLTLQPIQLNRLKRPEPILPEPTTNHIPSPSTLTHASVKNTMDHEKAANALNRIISKPDFARMQVLGQFNLGFMITCLDNQDLYIIDQHASDEKYNFETLQKTTEIQGQRLISPPVLDLTAAEEHVVMENLDIFKANGFDVQVMPDHPPTQRIRVISQPVSKNTMFDKKDFSEIIFLIHERPGDKTIKCSKNRAMFASRACHKATRIGDSLTIPQMTKIVRHMGEIDQPWNCPHGRPTMRHLLHLSEFKQTRTVREKRPLSFHGSLHLLNQ
ncbi:uncharacterized protein B0P05DRAFT_329885 [Gilbertella persicaria]|uniref:uncharacterized protein n=1 Tax=Gilbertella persicaria TaxID=101096 RepID=UPI00222063CC|nr:uncharacterized protein B0P05DRAFT_329885 [Gilbertella persicaria]KAI8090250.1 hypothetical protein B0P05DRAFT_329885 [Gilbertella persicaria]